MLGSSSYCQLHHGQRCAASVRAFTGEINSRVLLPRSRKKLLLHIANSRADRSTPVGIHQLDSRLRYLAVLNNPTAQFVGDVHGYISAPTFSGIEGDDAARAVELALHQITDQRLPVSGVFIGLAP